MIATGKDVAAAFDGFRPLRDIADRDIRNMEYTALLLNGSAVT